MSESRVSHHPSGSRRTLSSSTASVWALLLGIFVLMLGNGLQGSLLGVRAGQEAFGSGVTGLVMSCFFVGFLVGSAWTPRAVVRVGHIRVFAALTALASVAILVHAVFPTPFVWAGMRLVTGLCYAGIFVVAESWLNASADNENRGQLLAVYTLTTFLGMGGGQFLLRLADTQRADLFILASILISVAVVPMLLSATPAPQSDRNDSVGLRKLVRVCPLGTFGIFAAGLANGSIFGMGAVYAHEVGMSINGVAAFMGALIVGGAALQLPIGKLADIFDRRLVMTITTILAAAAALIADAAVNMSMLWFLVTMGLFGGLGLSLYSLSLAFTNDFLEPSELLGASSDLILALGIGSIIGPLAVGFIMDRFGPSGFFWWLFLVFGFFGLYALWRIKSVPALPMEEQGPYMVVPTQTPTLDLATEHIQEVDTKTDADAL